MKTLRLVGMALFAVLMSINFASCSNEDAFPDESTQNKYITVNLNCVGEYIDISESPLSRAVGDDYYRIQVYTLEEVNNNGTTSIQETPYAYGSFETSLDGATIKLLEGQKYKFVAGIVVNGAREEGKDYNNLSFTNKFEYSSVTVFDPSTRIPVYHEGFYGELDNYTPIEGENISIETKRVSYAAKFIAEDLSEGELEISASNGGSGSSFLWATSLTTTQPEHDKTYSFTEVQEVWNNDNYSKEKTIGIQWVKSDTETIPLGSYKITFKRNVKTTIRIKTSDSSGRNGVIVTKEETSISDDENEYLINGGTITEISAS